MLWLDFSQNGTLGRKDTPPENRVEPETRFPNSVHLLFTLVDHHFYFPAVYVGCVPVGRRIQPHLRKTLSDMPPVCFFLYFRRCLVKKLHVL